MIEVFQLSVKNLFNFEVILKCLQLINQKTTKSETIQKIKSISELNYTAKVIEITTKTIYNVH